MHGRITFYNDFSGVGAVVNQFKRNFEFKKDVWHDPSTLASKGMLVVFRLDESGNEKIVDIKASKFQIFDETTILKESEFWDTDDDEQLADVEDRKREDLIIAEADKINVDELIEIKESKSMNDCLTQNFCHQVALINRYHELFERIEAPKQIDYFKLKRFLEKALSQLMFIDKRVSAENFHIIKQELTELEFMCTNMQKYTKIIPEELFATLYERYQVEFFAVKRKLTEVEERRLAHKTKIASIPNEIKLLEAKSTKTKEQSVLEQIKLKIKANEELSVKLGAEVEELASKAARLTGMLNSFIESKKTLFGKVYEEKRNETFNKITTIINHVAYRFDLMIWDIASKSDSVRNTFYKQGMEGTFSCMTFLRYYLKPLNKDVMRDEDRALLELLQRYDKSIAKTVVIVSENSGILTSMKSFVFAREKDTLVYEFQRPVEFLNWIKNTRPSMVLIDNAAKSVSATDLAIKARQVWPGDNVNIVIFSDVK